MSDYELSDPDENEKDDAVDFWESEQEHKSIEFPSSPIRADTDKSKKRRRKKSNQLSMFGE